MKDFKKADICLRVSLENDPELSKFIPYYHKHVRPILEEQLANGLKIGFDTGYWTNNNAESKNYILKLLISVSTNMYIFNFI